MTTPTEADVKLRGGYYTPPELVNILVEWAIQSGREQVFEPSCGDGNFLEAVRPRLQPGGHISAVELFPSEAEKARERAGPDAEVFAGDVFSWYAAHKRAGSFDAVLGNPPFIRYQNFPESHRQLAFELMRAQGLNPSRLTNAWLPFVVLATYALRAGGRLAMVLPAEVLQVGYAAELREYLARNYEELTLVTFRRLVFKGIQQETVLLMGVRASDATARIVFRELHDLKGLATLNGKHDAFTVDLDHAREKWTQYYLSARELDLVRELERSPSFTTLGALVEVDVGIVTGRNEFFVVTPSQAANLGIRQWCVPLIGRSAQIPGVRLTKREWSALLEKDDRCLLVRLPDVDRSDLDKDALAYVRSGEQNGYHEGYKCRIRLPRWWVVPSCWTPDAFMLRQIYDGPRLVLNASDATCTDTIHRVRARQGVRATSVVAAAVNSLTFAFTEIRGRSYGGGVLELEPTEAEALPFPHLRQLDLHELDDLFRKRDLRAVLDMVDQCVLIPTGLSTKDITVLRGIWTKLASRRLERKLAPVGGRRRQPTPEREEEVLYSVHDKPTPPVPKTALTAVVTPG